MVVLGYGRSVGWLLQILNLSLYIILARLSLISNLTLLFSSVSRILYGPMYCLSNLPFDGYFNKYTCYVRLRLPTIYRLRMCKSRLSRVDLLSLNCRHLHSMASPPRWQPHSEVRRLGFPPWGATPGYISACTWLSRPLTRRPRTAV
jgi:hypothetical protein